MSDTVIYTILSLSGTGVIAAIILYLASKRFYVFEDPKIDLVENVLPGANCGGCGYAGCRNFAEAIVKKDDLDGFYCPVGGNECMERIAEILGKEVIEQTPLVAVVRCQGAPEYREKTNIYDGAPTCTIASNLYTGETACPYGCLGFGDCVDACQFDAIYMDEKTSLPVVIDEKCTACGACVEACPRDIIELRKKNKKDRKIFVDCINRDKGGVARKACKVACIGCGKCVQVCPFEAITLENNLAYIDAEKCRLCRKCVAVCPTSAIVEINFPPPKEKKDDKKDNSDNKQSSETDKQTKEKKQ